MSDSSDSDQKRNRFLNQAKCTIPHKGKQLFHTTLPVTVDNLFLLLYRNSKFLFDFHRQRKSYDLSLPDWHTDTNGKKIRKVNVTVPLSNPVLPKCSRVTETMELHECSKHSELYSFNGIVINEGIPYGDSFYVSKHYCLSRTIDNHTELSVYGEIKYVKSVFSFVKAIIEKNLWIGLNEFYASLMVALQSEYGGELHKTKVRRKKRSAKTLPEPPTSEDELPPAKDNIKVALERLRIAYQEHLALRIEYDALLKRATHRKTEVSKDTKNNNSTNWLIKIILFGLVIYLALYCF